MKQIDLLLHSCFSLVKREDFHKEEVQSVLSTLMISEEVNRFHPERRIEYLLGRYCAYKAYKNLCGKELISLPTQKDRSAQWPIDLVGSITHNQSYICCGISTRDKLLGVGIDVEQLGRTKMELARYIRVEEDLRTHDFFNESQLLTFIFSAKEALYKALYPDVKKFFGFESACVTEINIQQRSFQIRLLKDLNSRFNPQTRHHFKGQFALLGDNLFTAIEIAP